VQRIVLRDMSGWILAGGYLPDKSGLISAADNAPDRRRLFSESNPKKFIKSKP
jgi:hypothetical protein